MSDTAELLGVSVYLPDAPITAFTADGYIVVDAGRSHSVFHGTPEKLAELQTAIGSASTLDNTRLQAEEEEAFASLDAAFPVTHVDLGDVL